jgi:hypothetical protein
MPDPAYPAARAVAAQARQHFSRHQQAAREQGRTDLADEPDADTIEAIINAAFWASLRREEGRSPKISLAYVSPERAGQPLTFESWLPLSPAGLARLAPAVERPGIHLGVWLNAAGDLAVWGTTRRLPPLTFVLEVVTSGLLVIKHRSDSFGKFVNVAVLEGDEVKIVDASGAFIPECPGLLSSLLGVESPRDGVEKVNVLVQLATSMRGHGRGGALLVVPVANQTWADSIVTPALYAVSPHFAELAAIVAREPTASGSHEWQEDLRRAVDALGGLTAVDGATVITDHYELCAFGAKIVRRRGGQAVERVLVTEPVEGSAKAVVNPYQLGGTRHFSAAQFVHDQRDAFALVASQDGRFTIFSWSHHDDIVRAHRVEALLL